MEPALEPKPVTRFLATAETHGLAASELYLVLHAIRGVARLATTVVAVVCLRPHPTA